MPEVDRESHRSLQDVPSSTNECFNAWIDRFCRDVALMQSTSLHNYTFRLADLWNSCVVGTPQYIALVTHRYFRACCTYVQHLWYVLLCVRACLWFDLFRMQTKSIAKMFVTFCMLPPWGFWLRMCAGSVPEECVKEVRSSVLNKSVPAFATCCSMPNDEEGWTWLNASFALRNSFYVHFPVHTLHLVSIACISTLLILHFGPRWN